jgi:hypothetical protein
MSLMRACLPRPGLRSFSTSFFGGSPLADRITDRSAPRLEELLRDPLAKFAVLSPDFKFLAEVDKERKRMPTAKYLRLDELEALMPEYSLNEAMALGLDANAAPHFCIRCTRDDQEALLKHGKGASSSEGGGSGEPKFLELRLLASVGLSASDAAILGQARSLALWDDSSAYCGFCGGKTVAEEGGAKKVLLHHDNRMHPCITRSLGLPNTIASLATPQVCTGCSKPQFPRTDSVVITMVVRRNKVAVHCSIRVAYIRWPHSHLPPPVRRNKVAVHTFGSRRSYALST